MYNDPSGAMFGELPFIDVWFLTIGSSAITNYIIGIRPRQERKANEYNR
jgi:hypothetical protein